MSDPVPSTTPDFAAIIGRLLAPGLSTSEGKLSAFFTIAATVLAFLMAGLDYLTPMFPNSHVLHLVVAVAALLVALLAKLGYGKGRVDIKTGVMDLLAAMHEAQLAKEARAPIVPSTEVEGPRTIETLGSGAKLVHPGATGG